MPRYDAYLVRVWRGEHRDRNRWACRLEHLPDGHGRRFGSLEELLDGLRRLLATEGTDSMVDDAPAADDTRAP
jgi:hypothetical protein